MHKRNRLSMLATGITMAFALSPGIPAGDAGKSVVTPKDGVKWVSAGIPGVKTACVDGDMTTGPSHFFLSYPAGFASPNHHHSADHYVTTISGNLILLVDGKEHPLPPGSFFALTGKIAHVTNCEGHEPCVMFIDARGKWDVVPEDKPAPRE